MIHHSTQEAARLAALSQTEPDLESRISYEREIRRRRIENLAAGIALFILAAIGVAIVQIGYGIW